MDLFPSAASISARGFGPVLSAETASRPEDGECCFSSVVLGVFLLLSLSMTYALMRFVASSLASEVDRSKGASVRLDSAYKISDDNDSRKSNGADLKRLSST